MKKPVLDISYAQPDLDFAKVAAAGIKDVIIRNGYLERTDTEFDKHMAKAIANKFNIGTYTYILSNSPEEAKKEALATVARLNKYKGYINYPVFCDIEDKKYLSPSFTVASRTAIVKAFCETIEANGYYAAVYTNPSWLETYIDKNQILSKYDLWLAAWTNSADKETRFHYNQKMWQWGADFIKGITRYNIDCNLVYVDYPAIVKASGKNFLKQTTAAQPITEQTQKVKYVMKSLGRAAIRPETNRHCTFKARAEANKYYLVDAIITKGEYQWLKYYNENKYSMIKDYDKLFEKMYTFKEGITLSRLNVRSSAKVQDNNKVGILEKGEKVYIIREAEPIKTDTTWIKIIYKNEICYVAQQYIKQ